MTIFGKKIFKRDVNSKEEGDRAGKNEEERVKKIEKNVDLLETQIKLFKIEKEAYERGRRSR